MNTDIYIGDDLEFIIHVFYCFIQLDHEIYIKCKKNQKHFTWSKLYLVIISALKLKVNKFKSKNSVVPFHQVTFDHSISCVLLTETKWKLQKLKNIWNKYLIPQKKLLKRKGNITQAKTNVQISQTPSECLKLTIQTYRMRNKKNLTWSLDSFIRKYQKHLFQLVLI